MKRTIRTLIALAALAAAATPAAAQSDILLQLRSGNPAGDRFRVDSAGGFVALGEIGIGIIPASGAGWRMMWHPQKTAFRAGYADLNGQFDESNIGYYSWAGGALNIAQAIYSFSMGYNNQILGSAQGSVAFGGGNRIYTSPTVAEWSAAIGQNNDVYDIWGVAMGYNNTSNGDAAMAFGYNSTANAHNSMAFGHRASSFGHPGAIVFSATTNAMTTDSMRAAADGEFSVRAPGGFRFRSNATMTNGCNIAAGGAAITCASSKTLKENYLGVDGNDILARMRRIPVNTWNYIDEGRTSRHMGPFAEDFWREFRLGTEPLAIGHLDIDGVNFAGVKALDERTTRQAAEIEALRARNAELEARLARLEALIGQRKP
ncbi:MAG TPA: tail fiber domain-containing protein [Longimicrobium sp.]|jgi:hypothetical protein